MGGALRVAGNVYGQPSSDGSAEWNAFWDPPAVGVVFNSSVPLTLVPLDGTNKVCQDHVMHDLDHVMHDLDHIMHDLDHVVHASWVHDASRCRVGYLRQKISAL
jgi:inosine-uridine nucleoside N-ribohydrolase